MSRPPDDARRLAWWEALGAWLRIWTPPRDAAVPPVPWRRLGLGAAVLAVAVAVAAVTVAPAIDEAKREGAAERAAERAATRQARTVALRRDQRATVVPLAAGPIVPQLEAAVEKGVRARLASGELPPRAIRTVRCTPGGRLSRGRVGFDCLALFQVRETFPRVRAGLPFVAAVAPDRRSFAWCKINPIAGEGSAFSQVVVPLPRACAR